MSTQDNKKLLKQLEFGFKIGINIYLKQQIKYKTYLDFLIDESFQGTIRLFVLSFKDKGSQECYRQYYLPTVEIKDYNVMTNRKNFFD